MIDKLSVELNEKGGFYEVEFTNLGLKKVAIQVDFIKRYPRLLVGGIWAITDVEYQLPADPKASPWQIAAVKPIQVAVACSCRAWASIPSRSRGGASCSP